MAALRFANVTDKDISQFLEENENKNTARKTSQDVALFKTFLARLKIRSLAIWYQKLVNKSDIRLLTCNNLYLSNSAVFN